MTLQLRPHAGQTLGLLAVSVGFVAIGAFMVADGEWTGWFVLGFFGLCALAFAVQCLPGSSGLRLDRDGFTFTSLFRSSTVPWTEVSSFHVAEVGGRAMVCWTYRADVSHSARSRLLSRALSGQEAGLPDTYGLAPGELAQLLEDWRARHGGAGG